MLLYLVSKHGELSLLRLDNGFLSFRLISSILLCLEGRKLLFRLIFSLLGVAVCSSEVRLLPGSALRLGKGRRLSLRCRFIFRLSLGGFLCLFFGSGGLFCLGSLLCLFLGRSGLGLLLGYGWRGCLYLFLGCRGAYLSHVLVFNLI